jgi:hypothetical protein
MFKRKDAPAELVKIIDKVWGNSSNSSSSASSSSSDSSSSSGSSSSTGKRKDGSSRTLQHKLWMFDVNKPHSLLEGNTLLNLASRYVRLQSCHMLLVVAVYKLSLSKANAHSLCLVSLICSAQFAILDSTAQC